VRLYRQNGATIEQDVIIEKGSVLLSGNIHIGHGSVIGPNCRFECEQLNIGKMVQFNGDSEIISREVNIGDVSYFEKGVLVGLGGSKGPNSKIEIGKMCFIGMGCQLNTSEPIFIGDETCIGVKSLLLTHSAWQSPLEGYPVKFAPIWIGSNVWIGTDCFIMPGIRVENGSTVASKSVVTDDIPERCLYGGTPAVCIKDASQYGNDPSDEQKDSTVKAMFNDLKGVLAYQGYALREETANRVIHLYFEKDGLKYELIYSFAMKEGLTGETLFGGESRKVIIFFKDETLGELSSLDKCCFFDLTNKLVSGKGDDFSDEIRNFLRRRGIRFRPILWRYRKDSSPRRRNG